MYLSDLLRWQILNKSEEKIGKLSDVVVVHINSVLPTAVGFIVSPNGKNKQFFVPISDCQEVAKGKVRLSTDTLNFSPYEPRNGEVFLEKDILDKQIVDIKERQLTRINDIELSYANGRLFVSSVDVSFRSILNRLGIPTWGLVFNYNSIPWEDIQFLSIELPVKAKIDYEKLESLHPAEIARFIFAGPGYRKGSQIIQSLNEEIAADVLESLPLELQINIVENMHTKVAAQILSEVESNHAVDILSEFSSEKTEQVLSLMSEKQAKAARQLLTYPEGTVGSVMKVEYLYLPQNLTIEEAQEALKKIAQPPDFILYVYIIESQSSKKLVGVTWLWDLFQAHSRTRLEHVMIKNMVIAKPFEQPHKVLKRMTQYDLSALPIVNKNQHIVGILTLNDAIRLVIPKQWQTRVGFK